MTGMELEWDKWSMKEPGWNRKQTALECCTRKMEPGFHTRALGWHTTMKALEYYRAQQELEHHRTELECCTRKKALAWSKWKMVLAWSKKEMAPE
jgi:hypothetical protein